MTDEANPLDPAIEALLRSPAVWEDVPTELDDRIRSDFQQPTRIPVRWLVAAAAVAAVVVGFVVLQPPEPDWSLDIVAAPETMITGEVVGWNESTGTRVVLELDNLAPAQEGTFYEVWWVDLETGGAVSSGSFLEEDRIEMRMGIRRGEFPKVLITIEPSDGDPSPSGDVIAWSDN